MAINREPLLATIKIVINGLKVVVEILFCKLYLWIILSKNLIGFKQNMTILEVNIKLLYTPVLLEAGPKLTYLFLQQLNCGTRRLALTFALFVYWLVRSVHNVCTFILDDILN